MLKKLRDGLFCSGYILARLGYEEASLYVSKLASLVRPEGNTLKANAALRSGKTDNDLKLAT